MKIQFNYLENEAFKAKLATLLQSKDRPSAFHSWGGGVMYEQVASGICKDITARSRREDSPTRSILPPCRTLWSTAKSMELPNDLAPIVFWYNKELCQKAGVDPTQIRYWDDFVEAVKKIKAAGITPIAVGGKDKWPLHFYPALLTMRILGKDGFQTAYDRQGRRVCESERSQGVSALQRTCGPRAISERLSRPIPIRKRRAFHDGQAAFH